MIGVVAVGVRRFSLGILLLSMLMLVWVLLFSMMGAGLVIDFAVDGGGDVHDGRFQFGLFLSVLIIETRIVVGFRC